MSIEQYKLTPTEIGNNIGLDSECKYPCSDGGITYTFCVDKLLDAQLAKLLPVIEQAKREERESGIRLVERVLQSEGFWELAERIIKKAMSLQEG